MTQLHTLDERTARDVETIVQYFRRNGLWLKGRDGGLDFRGQAVPIYVKNEYAGEIPAYGVMQITGAVDEGGQNFLKVNRPADIAATAGEYLFNGPHAIEEKGHGVAQSGPVYRVRTDPADTITAGDRWGPKKDSFVLAPGGYMVCCGEDDIIDTSTVKVGRFYASSSPHRFFGKSSSLILSGATGTVTIWDVDAETPTTTTVEAKNLAADQGDTDHYLGISREAASGLWVIDYEVC